jgi:very-short-patch-repair endonuclease
MLNYKHHLKPFARKLREKQTRPELVLWYYLRKKQICGVLFGRQKPIGPYIVDFYAHSAKLVIELDGSQHYEETHQAYDIKRDTFLKARGLKVLRFNNLEVLFNTEMVIRVISHAIEGKPYTYEHGKFIEL